MILYKREWPTKTIVAMCLGYKYGTGCQKRSKTPKAQNWKLYQLCFSCYCVVVLKTKPRKGHGGRYVKECNENQGQSMIVTQIEIPLNKVAAV